MRDELPDLVFLRISLTQVAKYCLERCLVHGTHETLAYSGNYSPDEWFILEEHEISQLPVRFIFIQKHVLFFNDQVKGIQDCLPASASEEETLQRVLFRDLYRSSYHGKFRSQCLWFEQRLVQSTFLSIHRRCFGVYFQNLCDILEDVDA